MEWLFDLGNTRLKWALAEDGQLRAGGALVHAEPGFERRLAQTLDELPVPRRALLASVATGDLAARVAAIAARSGVVCEPVETRASAAGVRIAYADPSRLGVDRFLCLLGAHRREPRAWLVASVGTALTVDLLDAHGTHHGGWIAPSPTLMREALVLRVPHLDRPGGQAGGFASDTADALASGCMAAAVGMLERAVGEAVRVLDDVPAVLLTGGGAVELATGLREPADCAPDLVMEGLLALAAAGDASD